MSRDLYSLPEPQIQDALEQLREGGVSWVKEDFSWSVIEPARGEFDWTPFDNLMEAAAKVKMRVLGLLDYTTTWASSDPSGHGDIFYPPVHDSDFATYAAAVAARYGTRGTFWTENPSRPRLPLGAVQIWGEPYGSWHWKPGPDPAAYASLVTATAPAVHAADPRMVVVMSGDLNSWDNAADPHAEPWLAEILAADPGVVNLVNALSTDPYPTPGDLGPFANGPNVDQSFGQVPLIRAVELKAGVKLPIWLTEIGWSTAPDTPSAVSEKTQAAYMQGAIQRAIGDWGSYVSKIFVFGWYRSSGLPEDLENNFGLLEPDGAPKPAWSAITRLLGGSVLADHSCGDCPTET